MYPPLALFSISMLLPVLLASALPHSGSDIAQRAPSILGKEITLNFQEDTPTRYSKDLKGSLDLVESDEITDDKSVKVYDVTNLKLDFKGKEREVVAKTMEDNSKIKMKPELTQSNMLVGYGHDGAKNEADRRWWLLHIRPDQPRDLYRLYNHTFTLHWKEAPNSNTDWQTFTNLRVEKRYGEWTPGYYVTTEWKDPKSGKKGRADVNTKSDGSEMTTDEMDEFLRSRPLLAYGFEAATEFYPKRWWMVTKFSEIEKP